MDDGAEEEDVYVLEGFAFEEVVVLVGDSGGDGGGEGGHVGAGTVDCGGEVLDYEVEFWEGFGEGDADVAFGTAKLRGGVSWYGLRLVKGGEGKHTSTIVALPNEAQS